MGSSRRSSKTEESVVIGHYDAALGLDGALFIALVERDDLRRNGPLRSPGSAPPGHRLPSPGARPALGAQSRRVPVLFPVRDGERHHVQAGAGPPDGHQLHRGGGGRLHFDQPSDPALAVARDPGGSDRRVGLQPEGPSHRLLLRHRAASAGAGGEDGHGAPGPTGGHRPAPTSSPPMSSSSVTPWIHSGASAEDHAASLAQLRAKLEPLVARDPDLWTFAKGLPAAGQGNHSRYALRRPVLAHGTSAPAKHG